MRTITANTKISELIKADPSVIDTIAGINPHFKKLQNPLLRKILASRVTINDAARIGKCDIEVFFQKLRLHGFIIDYGKDRIDQPIQAENKELQHFNKKLDVRADIGNGKDPFRKIMKQLEEMKDGETLLLVNSFEPVPLIRILEDNGYAINVVAVDIDEVNTYIKKQGHVREMDIPGSAGTEDFDIRAKQFEGRLHTIDVRSLPMPQPMITILKELETLPLDFALYVHHKKMPLFLLPELKERNFGVASRPADDGVKLIIYRISHHDAA